MVSRADFKLQINGQDYAVGTEPRKLLSDVIREECGLTGTHVGCEQGVCGACTVLLGWRPVRSCLIFAIQCEGMPITTVEAMAKDGELTTLQQALHEEHGLQCGFCTPGILITLDSYLAENPHPSEDEVREVLSGNLCRCTGYQNVVRAAMKVVERGGMDRW